jgi:[ribosomal protein S5]-alanine N-acetyltransferase
MTGRDLSPSRTPADALIRTGYGRGVIGGAAGSCVLQARSMTVLRTERMTMRLIAAEDVERLLGHWNQTEVRRFLFDDKPVSREFVVMILKESEDDVARHGYGLWALHVDDQFAGVCGLRHTDDGPPELLYSLEPVFHHQGLATEAAKAVLDYAFGTLRLPEVIAETDEGNTASRQVAARLGMSERPDGSGGDLRRYFLRAADVPGA